MTVITRPEEFNVDRWPVGPFVNMLPLLTELDLGPCTATVENLTTGLVGDLMVTTVDNPGANLRLSVNGNPDLYDPDEVTDHLDRFAAFLDRFAAAPAHTPVGEVPLFDPAEAGDCRRCPPVRSARSPTGAWPGRSARSPRGSPTRSPWSTARPTRPAGPRTPNSPPAPTR
ncbi:hypothetical protein SFUMM280S_09926 [Streptomyces fumanus]